MAADPAGVRGSRTAPRARRPIEAASSPSRQSCSTSCPSRGRAGTRRGTARNESTHSRSAWVVRQSNTMVPGERGKLELQTPHHHSASRTMRAKCRRPSWPLVIGPSRARTRLVVEPLALLRLPTRVLISIPRPVRVRQCVVLLVLQLLACCAAQCLAARACSWRKRSRLELLQTLGAAPANRGMQPVVAAPRVGHPARRTSTASGASRSASAPTTSLSIRASKPRITAQARSVFSASDPSRARIFSTMWARLSARSAGRGPSFLGCGGCVLCDVEALQHLYREADGLRQSVRRILERVDQPVRRSSRCGRQSNASVWRFPRRDSPGERTVDQALPPGAPGFGKARHEDKGVAARSPSSSSTQLRNGPLGTALRSRRARGRRRRGPVTSVFCVNPRGQLCERIRERRPASRAPPRSAS